MSWRASAAGRMVCFCFWGRTPQPRWIQVLEFRRPERKDRRGDEQLDLLRTPCSTATERGQLLLRSYSSKPTKRAAKVEWSATLGRGLVLVTTLGEGLLVGALNTWFVPVKIGSLKDRVWAACNPVHLGFHSASLYNHFPLATSSPPRQFELKAECARLQRKKGERLTALKWGHIKGQEG